MVTMSKLDALTILVTIASLILLYHVLVTVFLHLILAMLMCAAYRHLKGAVSERVDIRGKGVLITGCDTGFGHHLAKKLESLGCVVYAGCLLPDGDGAKTLKELRSNRMHVIHLDVTKDSHVADAVNYVEKVSKSKGLWAVVNNAAIERILDVELVPIEQMKRVAEVNFYGMVRVTKAFIPMIRKSKGRIVNVTSVKGRVAVPHDVGYCVTKYAAEAFSDILRREMYKFGVKVSIVEPGYFDGATGMLNETYCDQMEAELKEAWATIPTESRNLYGWEYVSTLVQRCRNGRAGSCHSPSPVLNAIVDAIANVNPKCRYLVHGSQKWFDMWCVLCMMNEHLPESLVDWYLRRANPPPKLAAEQ